MVMLTECRSPNPSRTLGRQVTDPVSKHQAAPTIMMVAKRQANRRGRGRAGILEPPSNGRMPNVVDVKGMAWEQRAQEGDGRESLQRRRGLAPW